MQKEFISQRLEIGDLTLSESNFILELTNSADWIKFIGDRNLHSAEDAEKYIQKLIDNPDVHYRVVKLKDEQISIGVITMIKRDYLPHHDIGFAFLPQFGKQGYAREASEVVLDSLACTGSPILAITMAENTSSIQLLEKLGFGFDKEVEAGGEVLLQYSISPDTMQISQLTKRFFGLFTNSNGEVPNWERIYQLCIPEAIIIKKAGAQQEVYNLESFIEPRKAILSDGTLTDFEEYETAHTTVVTGNIAQRHSKFSKTGFLKGQHFKQAGHKLFQYIKTEDGWRICSVVWEDGPVA